MQDKVDSPEDRPVITESDIASATELRKLREELERLNSHRFIKLYNSYFRLLSFNLARGMAFGLGSVLGASVLLSLLAWSISQIEVVPILGQWATQILEQIEQSQ